MELLSLVKVGLTLFRKLCLTLLVGIEVSLKLSELGFKSGILFSQGNNFRGLNLLALLGQHCFNLCFELLVLKQQLALLDLKLLHLS